MFYQIMSVWMKGIYAEENLQLWNHNGIVSSGSLSSAAQTGWLSGTGSAQRKYGADDSGRICDLL